MGRYFTAIQSIFPSPWSNLYTLPLKQHNSFYIVSVTYPSNQQRSAMCAIAHHTNILFHYQKSAQRVLTFPASSTHSRLPVLQQ